MVKEVILPIAFFVFEIIVSSAILMGVGMFFGLKKSILTPLKISVIGGALVIAVAVIFGLAYDVLSRSGRMTPLFLLFPVLVILLILVPAGCLAYLIKRWYRIKLWGRAIGVFVIWFGLWSVASFLVSFLMSSVVVMMS